MLQMECYCFRLAYFAKVCSWHMHISLHNHFCLFYTCSLLYQLESCTHNMVKYKSLELIPRYCSLLCETIPSHHGYQGLPLAFRKKLLGVMDKLESLKPEVQHQVDELNQEHRLQSYCPKRVSNSSVPANRQSPLNFHSEQIPVSTSFSTLRPSNERNQIVSPDNLHSERSFQKMCLGCHPKEETLSRHSMLDPNGLWGHKAKPTSGVRVQYPSNFELIQSGSSRNQGLQSSSGAMNQNDSRKNNYDLESLLSHDDGRWSIPEEESGSFFTSIVEEDFAHLSIRQPSPPPVLANLQTVIDIKSPSKVPDSRPGAANPSQDGTKVFQDLHVPVKMMESFLRLAEKNTAKNLETCGILADEEEIFNVQDKLSLFPLGWIHTHPTQTCFMSSIDLHTHYSYQIMLPEAIAIVMAPTDTSRTHGIFNLTDPSGVTLIRNCQERGFHPHEEPLDGSPIYEHCSQVYMNANLKYDIIDLRKP